MNAATAGNNHSALMDSVYRGQRHIYDATRKFYLFGRDSLIAELNCSAQKTSVLEIACGTGRNLSAIKQKWPNTELFGIDISSEMLKSASGKLQGRARLAMGDATCFSADELLGQTRFDRVVLSYCLSMIPDWQAAFAHSLSLVAPGGSLHIVDFGKCDGLFSPLKAGLHAWLRHFHVTPRAELESQIPNKTNEKVWTVTIQHGPFGYYTLMKITRAN